MLAGLYGSLHMTVFLRGTAMLLLQCMSDTDDPRKCHSYREDYLECLHHRKEVCLDAHPPGLQAWILYR